MRQERKSLKQPYNVWKDSKNLTLNAFHSDKAYFSSSTRDAAEGAKEIAGIITPLEYWIAFVLAGDNQPFALSTSSWSWQANEYSF
jgi:hypothetical protein